METSRREQRIGYVIAVLVASFVMAWLAWISWGALRFAQSWG